MDLVLYSDYMITALLGVVMASVAIIAIVVILMMFIVRIVKFSYEERESNIEKRLELEDYIRKHRGF